MESDYQDIKILDDLDKGIVAHTGQLLNAIDNEVRLEIVLLHELKEHKGKIAQSISMKSKFMQLYLVSDSTETQGWVDDWFRADAEVRKQEVMLRQLEGRRDSIKKKLSVYKERGI